MLINIEPKLMKKLSFEKNSLINILKSLKLDQVLVKNKENDIDFSLVKVSKLSDLEKIDTLIFGQDEKNNDNIYIDFNNDHTLYQKIMLYFTLRMNELYLNDDLSCSLYRYYRSVCSCNELHGCSNLEDIEKTTPFIKALKLFLFMYSKKKFELLKEMKKLKGYDLNSISASFNQLFLRKAFSKSERKLIDYVTKNGIQHIPMQDLFYFLENDEISNELIKFYEDFKMKESVLFDGFFPKDIIDSEDEKTRILMDKMKEEHFLIEIDENNDLKIQKMHNFGLNMVFKNIYQNALYCGSKENGKTIYWTIDKETGVVIQKDEEDVKSKNMLILSKDQLNDFIKKKKAELDKLECFVK